MRRSRLKNIINKSKGLSVIGESPFEKFKNSLPKELNSFKGDNYRLEAAWKAYGSPKDYEEAKWFGLINPMIPDKMPSIGYNEETDEYEYLNSGKDNDLVAKDIRVWDNDVIPLVKELKLGGYVRTFNEEKNCWTYSKNSLERIEPSKDNELQVIDYYQKGGKLGKPIPNSNPKLNSQLTGEDPVGYSEDGIPLFIKGDGTIGPITEENIGKDNLFELVKNSNANFAKRLQDPNRKFIKLKDGSWGNFKLAWSEDETGVIVYPEILEINGKLIDLSEDREKAWESAIKHKDYIYFPSKEAAEWFTTHYKDYYKGFLTNPQAFKQGGQMNVIPAGALHARKNNMELAKEGEVTHKGIPVVDNNGEQQAEVEKEEWTMTKELTEDVEKWYKLYFDENISLKDKDELAIKCGKRITKELLYNTDDRADLISKIEEEYGSKEN